MFLIRYYQPIVGNTVVALVPRPTSVDYPDVRLFRTKTSKDGATIVQRPMRDSRVRKWIWEKYKKKVPNYDVQWTLLETFDCQSRWEAGFADTRIEIWENDSDSGGFGDTTDGAVADTVTYINLKWIKVQFLQVTRHVRPGGGEVVYDQSTVEFVVDDDNYFTF